MSPRGKVALITDSSLGLGAGIATVFAREGAKLSLTGRNEKNLEEVAKNCKTEASDDVLTNVGDITQDTFRKTLVEATRKKFGEIDILVNNVGIAGVSPLQSVTKELYDSIMAIHVETPVFLTQLVAPYLTESKASVVNISSCGTSTIDHQIYHPQRTTGMTCSDVYNVIRILQQRCWNSVNSFLGYGLIFARIFIDVLCSR